MANWILSIVGIICLGILIEIVLPQGKTTKYIKGVFSLVVILVIVSPLPKLIGKEYEINFDGFDISHSVEQTISLEQSISKKIQDLLLDNSISSSVDVDTINNVVCRVVITIKQDANYSNQSLINKARALVESELLIDSHKLTITISS